MDKEDEEKLFKPVKLKRKYGVKFSILELEYPFDGRRRATLMTKNIALCGDLSRFIKYSSIEEIRLFREEEIQEVLQRVRGQSSMSSEVMVIIRRIEKELQLPKGRSNK